MATFRCARFPTGIAHIRTDLGVVVDFRDGAAEVDDPEVAAALERVPAVFGITRTDTDTDDAPAPRKAARRSRKQR